MEMLWRMVFEVEVRDVRECSGRFENVLDGMWLWMQLRADAIVAEEACEGCHNSICQALGEAMLHAASRG